MKLAEALIQRADHRKRLDQLRERLLRVARVQEGDEPAEDPAALLAETERTAAGLTRLIQRINRTNSTTPLDDGRTIADAIAERDTLQLRHSIVTALIQAAIIKQDRFTKSEVRFRSSVDIVALQRQADNLAQAYRELDTKIQAANWLVDLID
ncbi:MAG: DIP1984 family protein [Candidatus Promineofilum sp.]|nr:DIP1984 family protein [Promineifilum sp.]